MTCTRRLLLVPSVGVSLLVGGDSPLTSLSSGSHASEVNSSCRHNPSLVSTRSTYGAEGDTIGEELVDLDEDSGVLEDGLACCEALPTMLNGRGSCDGVTLDI